MADKYLGGMKSEKLCSLPDYGRDLQDKLAYVWCQWHEHNAASLVPFISNRNLPDLVTERCYLYYLFDQEKYCLLNASLVVDPSQAFRLLRWVLEESHYPGVLSVDSNLAKSSHHHFPVIYSQYLQDIAPGTNLIRTIKVRDRGIYVKGKDVHVEWTTPENYTMLYPRNNSITVPRTAADVRKWSRDSTDPFPKREDTGWGVT